MLHLENHYLHLCSWIKIEAATLYQDDLDTQARVACFILSNIFSNHISADLIFRGQNFSVIKK